MAELQLLTALLTMHKSIGDILEAAQHEGGSSPAARPRRPLPERPRWCPLCSLPAYLLLRSRSALTVPLPGGT